jgi:RNA polymerase sigma factor (TIGR02999 family)
VIRDARAEVTATLTEMGNRRAAEPGASRLLPIVYDELRRLAASYLRRERPGHTLQPTALVHEAFLRLVDQERVAWKGQTHFFAVAAQAMRRVLVDHARRRARAKRGGGWLRLTFDDALDLSGGEGFALDDVLALDQALTRLSELDPREAQLVEQRFFAGRTLAEAAEELGISLRTAESDWAHAKAWLSRELSERAAAK